MAFKDLWINHLGGITSAIPVRPWLQWTGQRVILPFYHAIADEYLPHISPIYPVVSVAQFREDLDFMLQHFRPIGISELIDYENAGAPPRQPVFHLTFDDGLRQSIEVIAPILEEKGVPATFFVNSAFANNRGLFFRYKVALMLDHWKALEMQRRKRLLHQYKCRDEQAFFSLLRQLGWHDWEQIDAMGQEMGVDFGEYLRTRQPYLTTAEMMDLQERGFAIGAHSVDHPLFAEVSEEEQKRQVLESLDFAQTECQARHRLFAFPFSDDGVRASFIKWLHQADGGNAALSFGTAGLKQDVVSGHWQRIPMEGYNTPGKAVIHRELAYYFFKGWMGQRKVRRPQ